MLTDLRYAFRMLGRAPGFGTVAVCIIAVGIGGTVSVFSLFHAVLLAPLPFPDADRLVTVTERRDGGRDASLPVSGHEYAAWQGQTGGFEGLALHSFPVPAHLTGAGEPALVGVVRASAGFFDVLGVQPAMGRGFVPDEDGEGGAHVAVISDAVWRGRFGADATVLGRTLTLDGTSYAIVGVMPPLPKSLSSDVWVPLDLRDELRAVGRHRLRVLGRLEPGVAIGQAHAELQTVSQRLAGLMPDANTGHHAHVASLRESLVGEYRAAFVLLLAAAGFVLLIACANLANLLLTRTTGRQGEMAVRSAIGAARGRLIRQMLTEHMLLGMIGGALGLLIAMWMVELVPVLVVADIPLLETARVDWRIAALCAVLAIATGLAVGLVPALRGSRPDVQRCLTAGRGVPDDHGGWRLRAVLVASEVAWTLVLLIGAGLMLNSFVRLLQVEPGFDTANVVVMPVDLPGPRYEEPLRRLAFYDELLAKVRAVPGVVAAGAVSHLPLSGADNWMPLAIEGRPEAVPGQELSAAFRVATPEYFTALRIPLVAGRLFTDADRRLALPVIRWFPQQPYPPAFDRPQPPPVAVISESAARSFWPDENPIGRRIRVLFSPEMTVVGIVGDVKHNALNQPFYPHVYLPHNQEPWNSLSLVVRTAIPPHQVVSRFRDDVRALDAALPVALRTMEEMRSETVAQPRFYALLVGLFAAIALGLAIVGIFGVVSVATAQRRTEIGVRLALGARPREILTMVLAQTVPAIAAGVVAGMAGALALNRFVDGLLFDVDPTDPLTFTTAAALIAAVALLACWAPARRAARLDPLVVLRER